VTSSDSANPVPPWPKFARPVLEVLNDAKVWKTRDLTPAAVDKNGEIRSP
jgi:5-methylcytosine-specific restriction protein B